MHFRGAELLGDPGPPHVRYLPYLVQLLGGLVQGLFQGFPMLEDLPGFQLPVEGPVHEWAGHLTGEAVGHVRHHGGIHFHLLEEGIPNLEEAIAPVRPVIVIVMPPQKEFLVAHRAVRLQSFLKLKAEQGR